MKKKTIFNELVLILLDHSKPFEVQMDAFDFAFSRVFMQEDHPIAFESQKLNDTESHNTVLEKMMAAIINCL